MASAVSGPPDAAGSKPPSFVIVGVSRARLPPALAERLLPDRPDTKALLDHLKRAGSDQVLLLATCDRAEVVALHAEPEMLSAALAAALSAASGIDSATVAAAFQRLDGTRAVERLMAIAGGLESTLLGEPQVLAQVREAVATASAAGCIGPELDRLAQAALAFGKRVRTETAVGRHVVSIASATVGVAREVFGDLGAASALVLGASEAGMVIAARLREAGLAKLTVADPSEVRAALTGRETGARIASFAELDVELPEADIVVSGVGRGGYLLDIPRVDAALRRRRRRPMFLVDVAAPADIAPDVHRLEGAFLYTLADLEKIAEQGLARRREAAIDAAAMAAEAAADFLLAEAERAAVPALRALRERFEAVRAELLAERPDLSADEATRLLIARLLHGPAAALKAEVRASAVEGLDAAALVRIIARLFALPGADRPIADRSETNASKDRT